MTTTNIINREPTKLDYASPIQFRFKITNLPIVEFFIQTANIPGINLGTATVPTPLYDYPVPGDTLTYQSLDISFLCDENLSNYKELHDWLSGLGFAKNHTEFADYKEQVPTDFLVQQQVRLQQVHLLNNHLLKVVYIQTLH